MTPFNDVYLRFFSKIPRYDFDFSKLNPEIQEMLIEQLLMSAIPKFKHSKVDINDFDTVLKQFNNKLNLDEVDILAQHMVISWLNEKILNENNLMVHLGSKDYTLHSPGNLLDKMILLKKGLMDELNEQINFYYYTERVL